MPRYPENPVPRDVSEPLLIHGDDPTAGYLIHPPTARYGQQPAPYAPPSVAHPTEHQQPLYYATHAPAPNTAASPLLKNLALGTGILLGVGAALWLASAFITALAALLQSLALVLAVLVGGAVVLRFLAGSGGRSTTNVDVVARGRSRVHVNARNARVRRR